jgi:hypothetical protein
VEKFLFGMFMVVCSIVSGAAGYGLALVIQVLRQDHSKLRKYIPRLLVKAGYLGVALPLLIRLAQAGTVPPSGAAWFFLGGLAVAGMGIVQFIREDIETLALSASKAKEEVK